MSFSGADTIRVVSPLFHADSGGSIPTSALQLQITYADAHECARLNALWHSRMPRITPPSICYPCFAAQFDGVFYAIAMWSRPIAANRLKRGDVSLELRRMAISDDAPKNTASRMIAVMTRVIKRDMPGVSVLLSYQDTGVHSGTIYKASGWTAVCKSKYRSWSTHPGFSVKEHIIDQSNADKIRWEKVIR